MNRPLLLAAIGVGVVIIAILLNFSLWREEADRTPLTPQAVTKKAVEHADNSKKIQKIKAKSPLSFDIVRINPTGDAVIAGRAIPGSIVAIMDDGKEIGVVNADDHGEWVFIPEKPLNPGIRKLTLEMRIKGAPPVRSEEAVVLVVPVKNQDIAGRDSESSQALALKVTQDGSAASSVLQKPTPQGKDNIFPLGIDTVDYDNTGKMFVSGHAAAKGILRVYLNNNLIGHTVTDNDGIWRISPASAVTPGNYTLRADHVNAAGKVLARMEIPFSRAERQKKIEGETSITIQPGNSLWRIARSAYGQGTRYTTIYEANKNQIKDPDMIYPGQVFTIPTTN